MKYVQIGLSAAASALALIPAQVFAADAALAAAGGDTALEQVVVTGSCVVAW